MLAASEDSDQRVTNSSSLYHVYLTDTLIYHGTDSMCCAFQETGKDVGGK